MRLCNHSSDQNSLRTPSLPSRIAWRRSLTLMKSLSWRPDVSRSMARRECCWRRKVLSPSFTGTRGGVPIGRPWPFELLVPILFFLHTLLFFLSLFFTRRILDVYFINQIIGSILRERGSPSRCYRLRHSVPIYIPTTLLRTRIYVIAQIFLSRTLRGENQQGKAPARRR